MTEFIQNITGLKPQHQQETPLFEKTYIPPRYGSKLVSRIYADGSLYYLSEKKQTESIDTTDQQWSFISLVSEKGMELIKRAIEIGCNISDDTRPAGNNMGATIWKLSHSGQIQEIVIPGIPSGKFMVFLEIDNAINLNIIPFSVG